MLSFVVCICSWLHHVEFRRVFMYDVLRCCVYLWFVAMRYDAVWFVVMCYFDLLCFQLYLLVSIYCNLLLCFLLCGCCIQLSVTLCCRVMCLLLVFCMCYGVRRYVFICIVVL